MKLFTHHKRAFRLDGAPEDYDPTKGMYWQMYPLYREALVRLQGIIGTSKFLWCEVVPEHTRTSENHDIVQWELEVLFGNILAFLHKRGNWHSLFQTKVPASVDWDKLFCHPTEDEATDNRDLTCLVRYPFFGAKMNEMDWAGSRRQKKNR